MKSKLIFINFTLYSSILFAQQGSCDPLWQSCTNDQLQIQIMQQQLIEMQRANNLQRQILRQQKQNQEQLEMLEFQRRIQPSIPLNSYEQNCLLMPLGTRGC
jgi:hypothetical protein